MSKNKSKMKTNFFKIAAIFAGLALTVASCNGTDPEQPKPVFPSEKIQKTVLAGESVNVEFDANLDWELSLSGEGVLTYFWIDDAGSRESKISGKAGKQNVKVVFSEDEELDNNRKCIVSLTMGGETREIAQIDRLKISRTIIVKVAEAFPTAFKKDDHGNYEYADAEEDATLQLVTFPDDAEYSLPIKVQTNFDWNLSLPEWLSSEVSEGEAGDTELVLVANLSKEIAEEGTSAEIKFIDAANSSASESINVSIPPFADRVDFYVNTLDFNAEGQVKTLSEYVDGGAAITVLAAEGAVVKVLGFGGEWHDTEFADWTHVKKVSESGEGYLKKQNFILTVDPNKSEARVADVLVLPASKSGLTVEQLCDPNSDDCAFVEEVSPYVLGRLTQAGAQGGTEADCVLSVDTEYDNYMYQFTFTPDSWLTDMLPSASDQAYSLVYSHEFSEAQILSSTKIAYAMVCDFNLEDVDDSFWASVWVSPDGDKFKISHDMSAYQRVGAPDEELVPECFVVLFDEKDLPFAVVDFKYDANASSGEEQGDVLSVASGSASLDLLDPSEDMYAGFFASEYNTKNTYKVLTADHHITLRTSVDFVDVALRKADDPSSDYDMTGAPFSIEPLKSSMGNDIDLYFNPELSEKLEFIVLVKQNDPTCIYPLAIYVTYDPSAAVAEEVPFSFVYPDNVRGASLRPYDGDESILDEFQGVKLSDIYVLEYTYPEPSMAMLNVPGEPELGEAWNNFDSDPDYWLTYEKMSDSQIYVNMTENGKEDCFVWKDGYYFKYILVCRSNFSQPE